MLMKFFQTHRLLRIAIPAVSTTISLPQGIEAAEDLHIGQWFELKLTPITRYPPHKIDITK